jgi:hypothetical protein
MSIFHFFPERRPDDLPTVLDRFTLPRFDGAPYVGEPYDKYKGQPEHAAAGGQPEKP